MMPFDAAEGTAPEWIALALLAAPAGWAVARAWGPRGATIAHRALLVLALDAAFALVVGVPYHALPFALALLPVLGAAVSFRPVGLEDNPAGWIAAALLAFAVATVAHVDPEAWAAWWFVGFFAAAAARGLLEPALTRFVPWLRELRATRVADEAEPSLK